MPMAGVSLEMQLCRALSVEDCRCQSDQGQKTITYFMANGRREKGGCISEVDIGIHADGRFLQKSCEV